MKIWRAYGCTGSTLSDASRDHACVSCSQHYCLPLSASEAIHDSYAKRSSRMDDSWLASCSGLGAQSKKGIKKYRRMLRVRARAKCELDPHLSSSVSPPCRGGSAGSTAICLQQDLTQAGEKKRHKKSDSDKPGDSMPAVPSIDGQQ